MTLHFFGRLGDLVELAECERALPDDISDSQALRVWLDHTLDLNGALLSPSVRTAINHQLVNDPHPVSDRDDIAFLPPVGGG